MKSGVDKWWHSAPPRRWRVAFRLLNIALLIVWLYLGAPALRGDGVVGFLLAGIPVFLAQGVLVLIWAWLSWRAHLRLETKEA